MDSMVKKIIFAMVAAGVGEVASESMKKLLKKADDKLTDSGEVTEEEEIKEETEEDSE